MKLSEIRAAFDAAMRARLPGVVYTLSIDPQGRAIVHIKPVFKLFCQLDDYERRQMRTRARYEAFKVATATVAEAAGCLRDDVAEAAYLASSYFYGHGMGALVLMIKNTPRALKEKARAYLEKGE